MTQTIRKTQKERREESTERLLKACLKLAASEGVSAITFDRLGKEAGYSRNLAFHKFGSKTALIEQVVAFCHRDAARARDRVNFDQLSGIEAIHAYGMANFTAQPDFNAMTAYSVLLSAAISEFSEALPIFKASHEEAKAQLIALVERGIADGSIRDDIDPESTAMLIGSQLLGLASQAIVDPSLDLEQIETLFRCSLDRLLPS